MLKLLFGKEKQFEEAEVKYQDKIDPVPQLNPGMIEKIKIAG